jgi:hypothetical protein
VWTFTSGKSKVGVGVIVGVRVMVAVSVMVGVLLKISVAVEVGVRVMVGVSVMVGVLVMEGVAEKCLAVLVASALVWVRTGVARKVQAIRETGRIRKVSKRLIIVFLL